MKKIYAFTLASAVLFSASAVRPFGADLSIEPFAKTNKVVEMVKAEKSVNILNAPTTAAAATIDDYAGEYTWNYIGLLENNSGNQSGVVTITVVDAATGEVTIDGIFAAGIGIQGKIKGTIDITAGTLTLPNKQNLGNDKYGDLNYFYIKEANDQGKLIDGASAAESVVATISGKVFTFPELAIFAVGDFNNESLGWWTLTYSNTFQEYEEPDDLLDLAEWNTLPNKGTMLDGWVIPVLQYQNGDYADPADFPLTVTILKNKENPYLYAVANPYLQTSGFPLSGGQEGYIVFDVTDPEFVLVEPNVFCGYTNGSNRLYNINVESFYVGLGYDKATIQAGLKDITEWSSYKVEEKNVTITVPNCRFNYPGALDKCYNWNGRADAMKAKITFVDDTPTSVENLMVNDDAPIEYYNLQGIRVSNPENGVYIQRQGNKSSKVRF